VTQLRRYPMKNGREVRIATGHGHIVVAVHDAFAGVRNAVKEITVTPEELDTLRSALADVAGETGPSEASP
jgi:hypothetical protein